MKKDLPGSTNSTATNTASISLSQCRTPRDSIGIDKFIEKLMRVGRAGQGMSETVPEQDLYDMLNVAKDIFMEQPMLLELEPPLCICGDIHGQFTDLMRMFGKNGFPNTTNYLFLGDYIDRGRMNLETITILLLFKIKYPNTFFLLRGNHETQLVNRIYGFYEELNRRYRSPRLYNMFQDVFNSMPLTALVGERILCMHGGLSPELLNGKSLDLLRDIIRPLPDPPNPSLPLDLLWADPDAFTPKFKFSIRGVSCTFGTDVVNSICDKYGLDLIVRAHQVVQDGYEFFANRKLVTIFSAPHYCGQFDNAAAVMHVSKDLKCSFKIFRPKFPNVSRMGAKPSDITTYGKVK